MSQFFEIFPAKFEQDLPLSWAKTMAHEHFVFLVSMATCLDFSFELNFPTPLYSLSVYNLLNYSLLVNFGPYLVFHHEVLQYFCIESVIL